MIWETTEANLDLLETLGELAEFHPEILPKDFYLGLQGELA